MSNLFLIINQGDRLYLKRKMKKSIQKNALPYCEIRNNNYLCTRKTEILNASLAQLARARDL